MALAESETEEAATVTTGTAADAANGQTAGTGAASTNEPAIENEPAGCLTSTVAAAGTGPAVRKAAAGGTAETGNVLQSTAAAPLLLLPLQPELLPRSVKTCCPHQQALVRSQAWPYGQP